MSDSKNESSSKATDADKQAAKEATEETPWPNQEEVVDGIIPTDEVNQDPDLFEFDEDEEDDDLEMED